MKKILTYLLIILMLLPLFFFFYLKPNGGFFIEGSISFIKSSLYKTNGKFLLFGDITNDNIPGDEIYIYIFSTFTNIDYNTMQYIPLNMILISLMIFCLSVELKIPRYYALIISCIFIYSSFAFDIGDLSFFVKGTGIVFFLIFLIILIKFYFYNKNNMISILLFIFAINLFFDYTSQMWMVIVIIPLLLFKIKRKLSINSSVKLLLLFMIILFINFRKIIYNGYFNMMELSNLNNSFNNFLNTIPIFSKNTIQPYSYVSNNGSIIFYINLIKLTLVSFICISASIKIVYKKIRYNYINKKDIIILSLLAPLIFTTILYLPIGLLSLGYLTLIYPLVSIYILLYSQIEKRNKIKINITPIITSIILLLTIINFVILTYNNNIISTSNTNIDANSKFLLYYSNNDITILSDINTVGKLKVLDLENKVNYNFYNLTSYSGVIDGNKIPGNMYIIVDVKTNKPTNSLNWKNYQPLSDYLHIIKNKWNIVYDEKTSITLK